MRMRPGGLAVANGEGAKGDCCGPRYTLLCDMTISQPNGSQQTGAAFELQQDILEAETPARSNHVSAMLRGQHNHDKLRHTSMMGHEHHRWQAVMQAALTYTM